MKECGWGLDCHQAGCVKRTTFVDQKTWIDDLRVVASEIEVLFKQK